MTLHPRARGRPPGSVCPPWAPSTRPGPPPRSAAPWRRCRWTRRWAGPSWRQALSWGRRRRRASWPSCRRTCARRAPTWAAWSAGSGAAGTRASARAQAARITETEARLKRLASRLTDNEFAGLDLPGADAPDAPRANARSAGGSPERRPGARTREDELALTCALAYPQWIARRRPASSAYILAGGVGAELPARLCPGGPGVAGGRRPSTAPRPRATRASSRPCHYPRRTRWRRARRCWRPARTRRSTRVCCARPARAPSERSP